MIDGMTDAVETDFIIGTLDGNDSLLFIWLSVVSGLTLPFIRALLSADTDLPDGGDGVNGFRELADLSSARAGDFGTDSSVNEEEQ